MATKKKMKDFYAVIHAGGIGTRLWPLSRSAYPKQFLQLFGGKSLLQLTVERALRVTTIDKVIVTTSRKYIGTVTEQVPNLPTENILCEPVGRSNLPPNIWAALVIGRGKVMGSFWSDHLVFQEGKWEAYVRAAAKVAAIEDSLILLGIKPTEPHTGYGYVEYGRQQGKISQKPYYRVLKFHEKPTEQRAKKYVSSGKFLWNSGMFIWKTDTFLDAAEELAPEVYQPMAKAVKADRNMNRVFEALPSVSMDEGISEKAKNMLVFKAEFGWTDLGDWNSFFTHGHKGKAGNVTRGKVFMQDTKDCLLISENGKLVATNDVKDLVVIVNGDVVFISSKQGLGGIKPLVDSLKESGMDAHL